MKTPYDKLAKNFTNCFVHMTEMADIPIYGKKPLKIFFSRTRRLMTLGLGMLHLGCGAYQVCSYAYPRLTLTYLTSGQVCFLMHLNLKLFEKLIFL